MTENIPFGFEKLYKKGGYARERINQLAQYDQELKSYGQGLRTLSEYLISHNFPILITIGYSAANMLKDLTDLTHIHLPPHLEITGRKASRIWWDEKEAVKAYRSLQRPFNQGLILEDFAETGKKTLELNKFLFLPLQIPVNFAFLTATDEAISKMREADIDPFVAISQPSDRLLKLLKIRMTPRLLT